MQPIMVFDLDGTLVDSVPDLLASANRLMATRGLAPFTRPEVTSMVGDGAPALVRKLFAARGRVPGAGELDDFLTDYMAHLAAETRPYPGAIAALDRMAADGWRMAICTNKPVAAARSLLANLGLLQRFAAVAGGDSYPVRKPDPGHLLATIAEAGGVPGAAVMLGDHHNDLAAARAARVPCIFAAWGYGGPETAEGAPVAATFAEVPGLAATLVAATRHPPEAARTSARCTSSPHRRSAS